MTTVTDQQGVGSSDSHLGAGVGVHLDRGPRIRLWVVGNSQAHRSLLAAGLAGSVLFNATFVIDGLFRHGYGALRQPMSALSLGHGGWVQIANFIVFGVLTCLSAIGWRATLTPGSGSVWYPRLKVIAGLALIAAGAFSQDPGLGFPPGVAAPAQASVHAQIHNVAAIVSLGATIGGMFVLVSRFRREPRWKAWWPFAALAGVLMMICLSAFGATMDNGLGGMFEKLASVTALVFTVSFVGRLLTKGACLSTTTAPTPEKGARSLLSTTQQTGAPTAASQWHWWLVLVVTLGAVLTATGGILALHPGGEHLTSAGRNYAEYFFTRNIAMAILLLVALAMRARRPLGALMVLTAVIQSLDAVTATATGRFDLVPVDLVFAAVFLMAAAHLSTKALWSLSSWRDGSQTIPTVLRQHNRP
ncbi:MAG: DUF998 domain-containing protein [Acidimicrobiales bacterium]